MKFTVFAAQTEDINSGWIWIGRLTVPARSVVRVLNHASGKTIYCEALAIEENFLRSYNQPPRIRITDPEISIVLNEWYRSRLGDIVTQTDCDLAISGSDNFVGHILACNQHPQVAVRLATKLGLLAVALGVIGVVLGVLSLR